MKTFTSTLCLIAAVHLAQTQTITQTVKGQVVDQQSKTPVIGATVVVSGSQPVLGSVTDTEGVFRISGVALGRQDLILSSVGYETKVVSNILVGSGKEVYLEIEMVESLTEMEAVEIIANHKESGEPLNDMATVSAISLSVEETSRYAATFDDPARAAVSQAGVTTGGDDLLNEIVIRGNSPKGILWRLEGVEIPNPNHFANLGSSAGGVSMLSANVLSNSDFFTGAFSAQYGNATSGIFDLNLRKGNFDKHEHAFQAGLLGIAAASEGPMSKKSNASYLINYRYSTLALFDQIGIDILGEQEDIAFQDLSFKVFVPTKNLGTFSIWGLAGANTYGYKADTIRTDDYYFEDEKQAMMATGVTHMAYLAKDTYIESIVSFAGYQQRHEEDSMLVQLLYTEDVREGQLRFSSFVNHKFSARSMLRVGGIYSRLHYNLKSSEWIRSEDNFATYLDEQGGTNVYQGFAQLQHRASNDLTINAGVHITHFGLNGNTYPEPRLGFRWKSGPKGAFTGGAGLHSRMETLALYMARTELADGTVVRNNKDLGFTRAFHGVAGYAYRLRPNLQLKAEVYYQYLFDVPVWPSDTTSELQALTFSAINTYDGYTSLPLANKGTGRNYGIELTLEKFFSNNYYFMATTSLYQSKYTGIDGVERNTQFNGNYIVNLLGGKEYQFSNGRKVLSLNGRVIYAGGKRASPILLDASREVGYTVFDFYRRYEEQLPAYFRVDVGIRFKINKERTASVFSIDVQNVLARENVAGQFYANQIDKIVYSTQLGMFPNLSYKIEF